MLKHNSSAAEKPKRVVILGSSGFVGKDLARALAADGVEVLGLGSKDLDLTSASAPAGLKGLVRPDDSLVFVSAITPDKGRDVRTLMKNLAMAENVAAFLAQSSVGHFVYIGSDAIYDDAAHPVRESSPASGASFHGYMHAGRELILRTELKSRIPAAYLRPCAIYGTGDTHNSYGPNRFLKTAVADKKITLFGEGEEKRDHLHIGDLSRLTVKVLMHRSEGALNVAPGAAVSFFDVAQTIMKAVGPGVELICQPRANPITHRHFDITAALKAFPDFRFTPLEEGIERSVGDLKTAGDKPWR